MRSFGLFGSRYRNIHGYAGREFLVVPSLILFWSVVLALLLWTGIRGEQRHTNDMVRQQARAFYQQLLVIRGWVSEHGGVFVRAGENMPPNPYLTEADRVLVTRQGVMLAKVNPAYLTRALGALTATRKGIEFRTTSQRPIRPGNISDGWETRALERLRSGGSDVFELTAGPNNAEVFRYMAPLWTESSCLQCHAAQGYRAGDLRGGISISIPAGFYLSSENRSLRRLWIAYGLIWLVGCVGISTASTQLLRRKAQAEAATKAKSEFLANMSHEIRTPLNGVMGMLALAASADSPSEQHECLATARASAETLKGVLDDILDLSKIEAGRLELEPLRIDVRAVAEDCVRTFRAQAQQKGVELVMADLSGVPAGLVGDPVRLRQVIANLLGNAVKFTARGRIVLSAGLEADRGDEVVLTFSVADTGTGIARDKLPLSSNRSGRRTAPRHAGAAEPAWD